MSISCFRNSSVEGRSAQDVPVVQINRGRAQGITLLAVAAIAASVSFYAATAMVALPSTIVGVTTVSGCIAIIACAGGINALFPTLPKLPPVPRESSVSSSDPTYTGQQVPSAPPLSNADPKTQCKLAQSDVESVYIEVEAIPYAQVEVVSQPKAMTLADYVSKLASEGMTFSHFQRTYGGDIISILKENGHEDLLLQTSLRDKDIGTRAFKASAIYHPGKESQVIAAQLAFVDKGELSFGTYMTQNEDFIPCKTGDKGVLAPTAILGRAFLRSPYDEVFKHLQHLDKLGQTLTIEDYKTRVNYNVHGLIDLLQFHKRVDVLELLNPENIALCRRQFLNGAFGISRIDTSKTCLAFKNSAEATLQEISWLMNSESAVCSSFKRALGATSLNWLDLLSKLGFECLGKDATSLRTEYKKIMEGFAKRTSELEQEFQRHIQIDSEHREGLRKTDREDYAFYKGEAKAEFDALPCVIKYKGLKKELDDIDKSLFNLRGDQSVIKLQKKLLDGKKELQTKQKERDSLLSTEGTREERRAAQETILNKLILEKQERESTRMKGLGSAAKALWTQFSTSAEIPNAKKALPNFI